MVVSRRGPPNLPCVKNKSKNKKGSNIFEEQPFQQRFSAAFLSSLCQQPFPAAFLSSLCQQLSQQPLSAAFFRSLSQQPFSSSLAQQLLSAAFLSSLSQQPFSAAFLSSLSQQLFSAAFLSSHPQLSSCCFCLARCCLGKSRAERPSVSYTKVKTACSRGQAIKITVPQSTKRIRQTNDGLRQQIQEL